MIMIAQRNQKYKKQKYIITKKCYVDMYIYIYGLLAFSSFS